MSIILPCSDILSRTIHVWTAVCPLYMSKDLIAWLSQLKIKSVSVTSLDVRSHILVVLSISVNSCLLPPQSVLLILSVEVSPHQNCGEIASECLRVLQAWALVLWEFETAQNFSLLTLLIVVGGHRCRVSDLSMRDFSCITCLRLLGQFT